MFESLSMFDLPALGFVIPSGMALLNLIIGTLGAGHLAKGLYTTNKAQNREGELGEKELEFLKQKFSSEQEGGRQLLAHNTEETDKMMARLSKEKAGDRTERRLERADILKSQNTQQQMQLIATLMQGMSQQGQQSINAQQMLKEPPPVSMMNLMRGGRY